MLIVLDGVITLIDIELIRWKVKIRKITLYKNGFPLIILRTVYYIAFIFHMLIGPGEGLIPIDCVPLLLRMVSAHFQEDYLSYSFHMYCADWS